MEDQKTCLFYPAVLMHFYDLVSAFFTQRTCRGVKYDLEKILSSGKTLHIDAFNTTQSMMIERFFKYKLSYTVIQFETHSTLLLG